MLTTIVSSGNIFVGRLLAGVVALALDHPFVMCIIMATLAGASFAVLLDLVGDHLEATRARSQGYDKSNRLRPF